MKTRKSYLFVANEWLSKTKEGSKFSTTIDIPLFKDGHETINNTDSKITVKTSDLSGAGNFSHLFEKIIMILSFFLYKNMKELMPMCLSLCLEKTAILVN